MMQLLCVSWAMDQGFQCKSEGPSVLPAVACLSQSIADIWACRYLSLLLLFTFLIFLCMCILLQESGNSPVLVQCKGFE